MAAPQAEAASAPIDVFFLLLPDSLILDWAGPAEARRRANRVLAAQGQAPRRIAFLHCVGYSIYQLGVTSKVGVALAQVDRTFVGGQLGHYGEDGRAHGGQLGLQDGGAFEDCAHSS